MKDKIITLFKNAQNWKAILSLIMGLVSIIPIMHLLSSGGFVTGRAFVSPIEVFSLGILSIPGMILGIIGLGSGQKN